MARKFSVVVRTLVLALGGMAFALAPAWGEGTETLGPAEIQLETGTGIVAAGVGLRNDPQLPQSGSIDIDVPGSVKQVLVYWDGQMGDNVPGDDSIIIDAIPVSGDLIGGPTFLFNISRPGLPPDAYGSAFRADITDLGLVGQGPNSLTIEGLEGFTRLANGAGVLVIFEDPAGTPGPVQIVDGLDFAFIRFPEPRKSTVAQTFVFPAEDMDRTATLSMFFSSVVLADGPPRPNSIEVTVAGTTMFFSNLLASNDGLEHDTLNLPIPIPAGADSLTVQAFSRDDGVPNDPATGELPSSLTWTAAGLSIPSPVVCSLGDFVFLDENRDGIQDPEDLGIEDVKLNLTRDCENQDGTSIDPNFMEMVRTDADGIYGFTDLLCGCKYIVEPDSCNFESGPGASCPDDGPPGNLEDLVETPPNQGDGCDDSDAPMAMTVLTADFPDDPCLDFGYFPPPVEFEKFTNGHDADGADGFPTPDPGNFEVGDADVPLVGIGEKVTWSYDVFNPGPEILVNVVVTDDQPGVNVTCPKDTLAPGETMRCMAMGFGLDLAQTGGVDGCSAQGAGEPVPTYENLGTVNATVEGTNIELTDSDPSHYCNPPEIMVEKFTNGHDGDDASGFPSAAPGDFSVGGLTVAELLADDAITWTYRVTNTGTEVLVNVVVTDSQGVFVDCPQSTLPMGEIIICTATGFADDLLATGGDVDGCDGQGEGEPRPTYENLATVRGDGETSGVRVTDDDPSHYCNPAPTCDLTIQKGCELPPPPPPPEGKCGGKLQQFTMIWTGGPITVSGPANDAPGGQVGNGDEVTFFGPFSTNDVFVNVNGGQSKFHVSCSDKDMDGDTTTNQDQQQVSSFGRDCGKFQGDGKGSGGINEWLLEGFVDKNGAVLDCTTDDDGPPASVCEFNAIPADCDTVGKPSNLTFVYTGGGCPGNNSQGSKSDCSGSIDPNASVTVTLDGGTLGSVNPGGTFIVPTTGSNTTIVLSNSGGTQTNDVHTSCSAPLVTGDVFGGLTLVGLDGLGLGTNVTYSYLVSNDGPGEVTDIIVTDNKLGGIGTIASLQPGDSQTLTADAFISETTTNVGTADGIGAPGSVCRAVDSAPVIVKVLPPPPCDVGIAFEKLEDDKVKWKLTNNSVFGKATLQTFTLDFPAGFDVIKEVKLDGAIYKSDRSNLVVGPGVTIGEDDWTESNVGKRELDPGETRTLEVRFQEKDESASPSDFDLNLTFEEGCIATFKPVFETTANFKTTANACGLGFELALVLPLLMWLYGWGRRPVQ